MKSVLKLFIILPLIVLLVFPSTLLAQEQQLTVTVSVPPNKNDAEILISSAPDSTTVVHDGDEVTFTVQYRLALDYNSFPFHLEASWDQGLIENTSTYIDAMEYVVGSASNAHDGSKPVINVTNRTIAWDVAALTPSTGYHTVTYKLRALRDFTTTNKVIVTSEVNASLQGVALDPVSTTTTLQMREKVITPAPTSTQANTPTLAPTPPTPAPFNFTQLKITKITDTSSEIFFSTSDQSSYVLSYGRYKNNLSESISDTGYSFKHAISLTGLIPKSQYYFRIKALSKNGRVINSDLFTFTTAKESENIPLTAANLDIYSNNVLLSSERVNTIILPRSRFINIDLKLINPEIIELITAEFRQKNVLGASTDNPMVIQPTFIETLPGVLSAKLQVPNISDSYNLAFTIKTRNGSYIIKNAPYTFIVSKPITVLNSRDSRPIESATVKIFRYQESIKKYVIMSQRLDTDYKTDVNGELGVILPYGKYTFEVSAGGYESIKKDVALGITDFEYPQITLKSYFSLRGFMSSSVQAIVEICLKFSEHVNNFSLSIRTLHASFMMLSFFELILLLMFFINNRKHETTNISFIGWLGQIVIVNLFLISVFISLAMFLAFTFSLGISTSYTILMLLFLNIYITCRSSLHLWKILQNRKML